MQLLQNSNYFELREVFNKHQDKISAIAKLEIEAHLLNTFNKNKESNTAIEKLMNEHQHVLSDSAIVKLLQVRVDNYQKLFKYEQAFLTNMICINNFSTAMDSSIIADLRNMNNIYEPLINVKPQKIYKKDECKIAISRDVVGLMNIDVQVDDQTFDFIFDTGAGMNVIKKSFAIELGLELLETSIDVNSATDKVVKSSLTVIDQLSFGEITVHNAVFLVIEDEMLEFPQANYFPLAIIGFPVIEELSVFSLTSSDTLIVHEAIEMQGDLNMRLSGLSPHLFLFNGKDTLEYSFDTGATKTHFTSDYYERYKSEIEANYELDTIITSSAGGAIAHIGYKIDEIKLQIGEQQALLKGVHVYTQPSKTFEGVYGNLGQDLIEQFDIMTMNFDEMYLSFD